MLNLFYLPHLICFKNLCFVFRIWSKIQLFVNTHGITLKGNKLTFQNAKTKMFYSIVISLFSKIQNYFLNILYNNLHTFEVQSYFGNKIKILKATLEEF